MGKVYVRVDDRLIHGQIVTAWCKTLNIGQIIAVDDTLAANPILQSIMTMGVPVQYSTQIVTAEKAQKILEKQSEKNRLVIVRSAKALEGLGDAIYGCENINLGNSSKLDDTVYQFSRATGWYIYLSQSDVNVLESYAIAGVNIISQNLPTEKLIFWETIRKDIGLS